MEPRLPSSADLPLALRGQSPAMQEIRHTIAQVADTDLTVLLQGESGTGKEVAARQLWSQSSRASAPFVKLNCAAIPHDLLESELFGYEAGAFTGANRQKPGKFELARNGTIFLDEISEMPLPLQAKMLHVLQDGEFSRLGGGHSLSVDVRVIAATNVDLQAAVEDRSFRRDLFYRLNVISIHLPPLRDRGGDIPDLVDYFTRKYAPLYARADAGVAPFSPEALEFMARCAWPGNIRELENLVKRYVILGDERAILAELLCAVRRPAAPPPPHLASRAPLPFPLPPPASLLDIGRQAAWRAEREAILDVLAATRWNRRLAAERLQISYKALQNKLKVLLEDQAAAATPTSDDRFRI